MAKYDIPGRTGEITLVRWRGGREYRFSEWPYEPQNEVEEQILKEDRKVEQLEEEVKPSRPKAAPKLVQVDEEPDHQEEVTDA